MVYRYFRLQFRTKGLFREKVAEKKLGYEKCRNPKLLSNIRSPITNFNHGYVHKRFICPCCHNNIDKMSTLDKHGMSPELKDNFIILCPTLFSFIKQRLKMCGALSFLRKIFSHIRKDLRYCKPVTHFQYRKLKFYFS